MRNSKYKSILGLSWRAHYWHSLVEIEICAGCLIFRSLKLGWAVSTCLWTAITQVVLLFRVGHFGLAFCAAHKFLSENSVCPCGDKIKWTYYLFCSGLQKSHGLCNCWKIGNEQVDGKTLSVWYAEFQIKVEERESTGNLSPAQTNLTWSGV